MENTQVGPFLILKRLGKSRRQKVFHARQQKQDRDVVLKFISVPPSVPWIKAIDKIQREAEELRKLKHRNLVRVYGAGVHEEGQQIFFAGELVEGEPLSSILARRGKLMPDLVADYGHQIAEALKYIHNREIIHSKLTPEKIIITADNKVKLVDIRLNRAKKRRWDATRKRDLEIAAYMAPEQFDEGATQKSDFYSLGVILYEMLTGKLPYEPDTMGRMARTKKEAEVPSISAEIMNCPIWMDKIVTQMLQPEPRMRPHSARAITFAFEEIKKIDATQKSAVSQVSGNFNPLTAGTDKTEAHRILGKKQRKVVDEEPFWKKTPFMVAALLGIMALVCAMAFWPADEAGLLKRAEVQVQSSNPEKWSEASIQLAELMASDDDEINVQAAELFYENREQMLEGTANRGIMAPAYSKNVNDYIAAVQDLLAGKKNDAIEAFKNLVTRVDPAGDERHIHRAAAKKLQQMATEIRLPDDSATLLAMVESCGRSTNELELVQSEKTLGRIAISFAGKRSHEEVHVKAIETLEFVREQLRRVRAGEPLAAPGDSETPADENGQ